MRTQGKVKWFNDNKGYGFIECKDHSDVFLHYAHLNVEGFKTVKEGELVSFELVTGPKGPQAFNVEIITQN